MEQEERSMHKDREAQVSGVIDEMRRIATAAKDWPSWKRAAVMDWLNSASAPQAPAELATPGSQSLSTEKQ
jgi:hypothetical protein